jgi:hypothetical protein
MKALFLAYQEQSSRRWAPVARVTRNDDLYHLVYTKGALGIPGFDGFGLMNKLNEQYVSKDLFPLLANRVLPKSRPEYKEYLEWLGLTEHTHDALEELARTGGLRATDSLELIPCPEPTSSNSYEAFFFARGIRHFPIEVTRRVNELKTGDRLFLMKDFQNQHDKHALLLRTDDPISVIGYAPKYYAEDFGIVADSGISGAVVQVERVNPGAPSQYRLLCRISAPWPSSFAACGSEQFQPIAESDVAHA